MTASTAALILDAIAMPRAKPNPILSQKRGERRELVIMDWRVGRSSSSLIS